MVIDLRQELIQKISQYIPNDRILMQEPMRLHTTFRVGGPAALYVELKTEQEFRDILTLLHAKEEDYFIVGNGSNLLISDTGYNGIILHPSKEFNDVRVEGEKLICESGATLSTIARIALEHELTGFEFASGIPGSLGGAIAMNAGAYDGEMKQVVEAVRLVTPQGEVITKSGEEMVFSYRHSILKEEPYVVLSVTIKLQKGDKAQIKARMDELAVKRREKQPLEYPSAGSTFKRPEGYFAAKLIEDAGLRGFQVGGAQVSEKHCGFVINKENATAQDICKLMKQVQEQVQDKFGVLLEPEVIRLGDF